MSAWVIGSQFLAVTIGSWPEKAWPLILMVVALSFIVAKSSFTGCKIIVSGLFTEMNYSTYIIQ
jgi:hypothetical protein